jgi:hypothetical protein
MNHPRTVSLLFALALGTALAAQEPQPGAKKGEGDGDKAAKEEVAARVAKNMKAAEERLKKTDPGDATRKIQRDVVDGLDEMIKQNEQAQGGKSSQKQKRSQSGAKENNDMKGGKDQQAGEPMEPKGNGKEQEGPDKEHGTAKGGKKDDGQAKEKDRGKGDNKDKEGLAKDNGDKDKKEGKEGEVKTGGKDGKDNVAGAFGNSKRDNAKKGDLAADLNRVPWGKLPDKMRLEMDVYGKERFMPRYDDLLRQYYRSIAEQSMKKDD